MSVEKHEVKGAGIVVALMLAVLAASPFVSGPSTADCTRRAFNVVTSPDGKRTASVEHRTCQSDKSSLVSVYLHASDRPNHAFDAFCVPVEFGSEYSPTTLPVSISWTGSRELMVTYASNLVSSCVHDAPPLGVRIILDQRGKI